MVYEQRLSDVGESLCVARVGRRKAVRRQPRERGGGTGRPARSSRNWCANDLGDKSIFNATPVPSDGRLLLRSDRFLYCLGK